MLPIIFSFGPVTLYTFGVVLFVGLFLSSFVIFKRGRELRFNEGQLFDALTLSLPWWFLAARLGFILSNWQLFGTDLLKMVNIVAYPGFGEISGLIGLALALWWQSKERKWDYFNLLDVVVLGVLIWQATTALGDFFNGSRAGLVTSWPIGVKFANLAEKRLPMQLVESLFLYGTFFWLWSLEGTYRTIGWYKGQKSQALAGFITSFYLIAYGFIGFSVNNFRPFTGVYFNIPFGLLLYLAVMILGGVLLAKRAQINWSRLVKDWLSLNPIDAK